MGIVLLLVLALLAALVGPATPGIGAPAPGAPVRGPCGTAPPPPGGYSHVVWVWMENHSYGSVVGSPQAPYIDSLAGECGLATNYHNVTHPSLPNYIAATSGLGLPQLGPFTSDCAPSAACSTSAPSIFSQATSWRAYEETMPSSCARSNSGAYAVRHDPPPYYSSLGGCGSFDVPYSRLAADLAGGSLPQFAFVTPDVSHDMHDGSVAAGDAWLRDNLTQIFRSRAYRAGTVAVFVTWDEGEGSGGSDCASDTTGSGCHVATLVASPSTPPGTRSDALFSHYSLLRTTEELLRLPLLGQAARSASMVEAFRL